MDKRLKNSLLICLILATAGSFALSTGHAFSYNFKERDSLESRGISQTIHTIDWIAEDAQMISRTQRNSNPALRNSLLRVFILSGAACLTVFHLKPDFKINRDTNSLVSNYFIPLKLLI